MSTLPPEIEATYDVLQTMGGGMGAVYKVRHRLFGEVRVIKVMQAVLSGHPELRERFSAEAKRGKQLKHPNIAEVLDFQIASDGTPCLVMEYIDGIDLREAAARRGGPFPPAMVVTIGAQTLSALAYLHDRHLVHRDISPDNLMLTRDAEGSPLIKLVDLGIAKSLAETAHITHTGNFVGKLAYASPEQFGGVVDARSDLYSMGVVLYELLTASKPITGASTTALIVAHCQSPPRPFAETDPRGYVPEALRKVVLKALEKKPEDRYQCGADFAAALRGSVAEPEATPTVHTPLPELASAPTLRTPFPELTSRPAVSAAQPEPAPAQPVRADRPVTPAASLPDTHQPLPEDVPLMRDAPPLGRAPREDHVIASPAAGKRRLNGLVLIAVALVIFGTALAAGALFQSLTRSQPGSPVHVAPTPQQPERTEKPAGSAIIIEATRPVNVSRIEEPPGRTTNAVSPVRVAEAAQPVTRTAGETPGTAAVRTPVGNSLGEGTAVLPARAPANSPAATGGAPTAPVTTAEANRLVAPGYSPRRDLAQGDRQRREALALSNAHRWTEAVTAWRQFIRDYAGLNHSADHAAFYNLGVAYEELQMWSDAAASFESAAVADTNLDDVSDLLHLGHCYGKLGRWTDAVAMYERALRTDPANAAAKRSLLYALRQAPR